VEVNPTILNSYGLSLEDVRAVLDSANANRPKGELADGSRAWTLSTTDQLLQAKEYQPLIISYRNGAAVRLSDVATVTDSVEDLRNDGLVDRKPSVLLVVWRQPGANIIETVDRVRALLPQLQAELPPAIDLTVALDRTTTIRASVRVQYTLSCRSARYPGRLLLFPECTHRYDSSVAVRCRSSGRSASCTPGLQCEQPVPHGADHCHRVVVDDAIVVIENIMRHLEHGTPPRQAALRGAKEIGFTVISITLSLLAVFIPILLMRGLFGRLFQEFAVTLSVAVGISLLVSLTTTPMMCASPACQRGRHGSCIAQRGVFQGSSAV
jgi:multidrug efflux pump